MFAWVLCGIALWVGSGVLMDAAEGGNWRVGVPFAVSVVAGCAAIFKLGRTLALLMHRTSATVGANLQGEW